MKKLALALLALVLAAGCHAQIPPSPPASVTATWTAPAACTVSAPCVYVISRAACSSTCPSTSGTAYTQVGTTAPNVTSFTDTNLTSGSYGWIVQAQQGNPAATSQPSGISNGGAPFAVTGPPGAPTAPSLTTTAELKKPQIKPSPASTLLSDVRNTPTDLKIRSIR